MRSYNHVQVRIETLHMITSACSMLTLTVCPTHPNLDMEDGHKKSLVQRNPYKGLTLIPAIRQLSSTCQQRPTAVITYKQSDHYQKV